MPTFVRRIKGYCQTENPKGIPPQSPGLTSLRGYPGMEASHIHNSEGVAPGPCELSVHGKPQPSTNVHWDHQPARPSPSLPLQERAGEKRPIGIWLLEFFWDLELGIWSFLRPVRGEADCSKVKAHWSLDIGAFLGFGIWDLELPRVVLITILSLAFFIVGCAPKSKSALIVGMELNYPPFEMVNPQGKPAGISVEMAHELGKFVGKNVQIENIPFDGLIPALKTGKIDLIISSMTETPERAKSIAFSDPYLRTGLCLLVNKSAAIDSIEQTDQPNFSVAVKQGTTGQLYAQQHLKHARILVLDKEDACVLEVVQNKAQAFIYDQMSIFKHWQQHQDSTKAVLKPFQEEQWAIGIRTDAQDLKVQVNGFLVAFKKNGGFDRLGDKYLKDQKKQFNKLGIPFYF